jgi:hypothetical protein
MRYALLSLFLLAACGDNDGVQPPPPHPDAAVAPDAEVVYDAGEPDARLCNPYTRGVVIGDGLAHGMHAIAGPYLQNNNNAYAYDISADGNTIANQLAAWRASPHRGDETLNWAYVHVGMDDIIQGAGAIETVANMGTLLADIHASNPGMKVYLSTLWPARGRLEQVVDPPRYPVWVKVNEELVAQFQANSSQGDELNDGTDALKFEFDSGNKITPNALGFNAATRQLSNWVKATFPPEVCQ